MTQGFTGAPAPAADNSIENLTVAFTRDMSLASGTQAVTGVGFEPKFIIMLSSFSGGVLGTASWGFTSGPGEDTSMWDRGQTAANTYGDGNAVIRIDAAGGDYVGSLSSFDSDGFTISWVRTSAPTGTLQMIAHCVR
jgi:hypothetical protein